MTRIAYDSNKQTIGDGVRVTRVSDGGQMLEVMVDSKTERFSRIVLVEETGPEPEPVAADDLIETVGTRHAKNLSYTLKAARDLREHIDFLHDTRVGPGADPALREAYLWDVIKAYLGTNDA